MMCLNHPKRGRKPKALSQKECETEDDMFKPPKRGHKPKADLSQMENNADNRVVKRKRADLKLFHQQNT